MSETSTPPATNRELTAAQRRAVAELMRVSPVADELGRRFAGAGHELHLVGGSVRDALLGRLGEDLDFTTDAPPEKTLESMVQRTGGLPNPCRTELRRMWRMSCSGCAPALGTNPQSFMYTKATANVTSSASDRRM